MKIRDFTLRCILFVFAMTSAVSIGAAQTTTATMNSTMVSSTTSASVQAAPKAKRTYSQSLRIFLETRNVVARPEGYETLLTIDSGGAMTFEWHTVSGKRKTLTAQLKPKEWKDLVKLLDAKKFLDAKPASVVGYADWMQSIAIEKEGKERTLRMMIDYRKKTAEAAEKFIQEQLGEEITNAHWKFITAVRVINERFKWQGQ